MAHPVFDELRYPGARLPNGKPLPPLFNFTKEGASFVARRAWLGLAFMLPRSPPLSHRTYHRSCVLPASRQQSYSSSRSCSRR